MNRKQLDPGQLELLRRIDSCAISNAIETFDVRLRNVGFTDSTVHCLFEDFPPIVGYAATARIRTMNPPMEGHSYYYRFDWLDHVLSVPPPRVLILQDLDPHPGLGAFIGDVHANILAAVGCVAVVTNGAVRNLEEARALKLQMFAGNLSVSHAFAHIFDFGQPVVLGHMEVQPGDLIHGDVHGVQSIPLDIAHKIPSVAREMLHEEQEIIQLCQSPDFTVERLRGEVKALAQKRKHVE